MYIHTERFWDLFSNFVTLFLSFLSQSSLWHLVYAHKKLNYNFQNHEDQLICFAII